MDTSHAEHQAADRAARRLRKRRPTMRVSGRGMKRFANPRKNGPPARSNNEKNSGRAG